MEARSPYERIQELIHFLQVNPSPHQLVKFLSRNCGPTGEICGVGWLRVNQDARLEGIAFSGVRNSFDARETIGLADNNVVSESLRLGKSIMFDMNKVFQEYRDSTHRDALMVYKSGVVLPIDSKNIFGIVLEEDLKNMEPIKDYFDLIGMLISLWLQRTKFEQTAVSRTRPLASVNLTSRQEEIVNLIKEGRTNASIASILGYSESLIRQETIIIYRKLGVQGRKQLTLGSD